MDHWYPKDINISKDGFGIKGYAMCYYFLEGSKDKSQLAQEIVKIKNKGWQYTKSRMIRGYLIKFFKLNPEIFSDIDYIVPVPGNIYSNRRMENLAGAIGTILKIPVINLIKCSSTSSAYHTNKDFQEEYMLKIKNFDTTPKASIIKGKKVLLVDDICTTGATLYVCGLKLNEYEPTEIVPFTLCTSREQFWDVSGTDLDVPF